MSFEEFKNNYNYLKTKEEKLSFIKKRIIELSTPAEITEIGIGTNVTSYNSFINPKMKIISNERKDIYSPCVIDDIGIYFDFISKLDEPTTESLNDQQRAIIAIQLFIWDYFGAGSTMAGRIGAYSDNPARSVSISAFKEQNIAGSPERSLVAQNLLCFLGINSEIIFGRICDGNKTYNYTYNIIESNIKGTYILYDTTNIIDMEYKGHRFCEIAMSKMSEEQYKAFKEGEPYTFDYDVLKRGYSGVTVISKTARQYINDKSKGYNVK